MIVLLSGRYRYTPHLMSVTKESIIVSTKIMVTTRRIAGI